MDNCYFIFREGKNFFSKFLKKGFGHCLVIYQYDELYLMMETTGTKVEITPILCKIDELFVFLKDKLGAKVVKAPQNSANFNFKSIFNLFPSCVNFSKVVLCYHSRAQTPFALYKDLLKNGGEEI